MKINPNGTIDIRKPEDGISANIFLTGDANPRFSGEERVLAGESRSILAPMRRYFQAADLSITQFETVLTTDDTPIIKSGPNLKNDPRTIDFFREWNGDVCLMANNHTGDFGPKPLMDTLDIIHKGGFKTVGAGKNLEEAYQPLIVERFGITIGILNFCENEFGGALADRPGSATLNPMLNVRQIMKLRPQVDVLLVVTHGGNEQDPFPSPRVVDMLRTFIDVGADMVVNIHTHCPQGIEIWNGKPIVYSLGNFYFPPWPQLAEKMQEDNFWLTGYCVQFTVDKKGCSSLKVVPTHFEKDGSNVHPLEGKQFDGFIKHLQEISDVIADETLLKQLHECWSAQSSYVHSVTNPRWTDDDFFKNAEDPETRKKVIFLRNLFTCEAHNELLRTFFFLYEQCRVKDALKLQDTFQKYGTAKFML